jgi:hypothetical protein
MHDDVGDMVTGKVAHSMGAFLFVFQEEGNFSSFSSDDYPALAPRLSGMGR